jgi:hypothetical protein
MKQGERERERDSRSSSESSSESSSVSSSSYQRERSMPFFGYARASIGTGLSVTFSQMVRVEMTYSVPLLRSNQDQLKAFQLGVGLSIN